MPQRQSGLHIPKPTKPRLTEEQASTVRIAMALMLAESYGQIHAKSPNLSTFIAGRFGGRRARLLASIASYLPWTGPRLAYALSA